MQPILLYISRLPKTTIAMILGAINTYLVTRGYITVDTATLISSIFIALGITVNVATNNVSVQSDKQ